MHLVVFDLALPAVVGLVLLDVHDLDLPRHVVIDLSVLAVVGLALPDVHVHVILYLALCVVWCSISCPCSPALTGWWTHCCVLFSLKAGVPLS